LDRLFQLQVCDSDDLIGHFSAETFAAPRVNGHVFGHAMHFPPLILYDALPFLGFSWIATQRRILAQ